MVSIPLTGSRIRSHRIDKGIRQADLARSCGISASYMNLIEHNRRRIGGALLVRIAKELSVDPGFLSGRIEVRIATDIDAAAELHSEVEPERARSEELAARFPGWARLIAHQYREIRRLQDVIERLGDRLTHDPFLSASMHNVLTSVTAIRSASAILAQGDDIEPEWQARFHRNIFEDSQRLARATEDLVGYLDGDGDGSQDSSLPQDELDRWIARLNWRVEALEANPDADLNDLIDLIDGPKSKGARELALSYLERYARDVAGLSLARIIEMHGAGDTPMEISRKADVSLPTVFRRLSVLRAEETRTGESFGVVACDASGTLTFRKPLPGFELPRYSAACPYWPIFTALQRPMMAVSETVDVSGRDEARFDLLAISEQSHPGGYDRPPVAEAWMLIHPADRSAPAAMTVGMSCRICTESDCAARREPSVFA